jgi:hypothetical protein
MPFDIYVVDSNKEAVDTALAMRAEKIVGGTDVSILPKQVDVAIIATSSAGRRTVFEQLVKQTNVKYVIFEKVLFQRIEDYFAVKELLLRENIEAWVNCARRVQDSYEEIKRIVDGCHRFSFEVTGGNWGLGSSGIHFLDLIEYLSGSNQCKITNVNLLPIVVESKRKGYKEIFGSISGDCGKCESFSISCFKDSDLPLQISLSGNNFRCTILEQEGRMILLGQEKEFPIYYQSQLTQGVVERLIKNGTCRLPDYEDAMNLHLKYIEPLMKFFEEQGLEKGICPIT